MKHKKFKKSSFSLTKKKRNNLLKKFYQEMEAVKKKHCEGKPS